MVRGIKNNLVLEEGIRMRIAVCTFLTTQEQDGEMGSCKLLTVPISTLIGSVA